MNEQEAAIRATELAGKHDYKDGARLDDAVHDVALAIGSAVNNNGLEAQIEFLFLGGYTEKEIEQLLNDEAE